MEIQSNARDTALLNGTLAHGLDYDDRNHSTTYTLASSIALTEGANAGGREALEAFIVGREVRASLDSLFSHRSSGIGPGARGWHSNGILGPIASACSASKALKLGTTQTLAAIHRTSHLPKEEVLTVTLKNGKKLSDPFQPPNESYGAVANQRKIRPIGEPGFFAGTGTGNCGLCHASGRATHEFTKNVTCPLASFLGKLPEGGKP